MLRRALCLRALFSATLLLSTATLAGAAVTRVGGPTTLFGEGRAFVKFDAAYDSINRVYLVVYGTQAAGPVNGFLLNESGARLTDLFALSDGPQQSGWARVIFSKEHGKFLVSYVRILGGGGHQKVARFVTISNNAPVLGSEIVLDQWTGDSGTASGMAYAAASGKFLVTWSHYVSAPLAVPNSFVATIDGNGAASAPRVISNQFDGQSDPEIACDPASRACLVIGGAWGMGTGGKSSFWARYIDDSTGTPLDANATYVAIWGGLMDPAAVVFSPATSATPPQFLMGIVMGGVIKGIAGDGPSRTFGTPFVMMQDTTGTEGSGYGFLGLRYNAGSQTTIASLSTWIGRGAVQELDGAGRRISGGFDLIPETPENPSDPWNTGNQFTVVAPNSVTSGFLTLENHYFKAIRVSAYGGTTSNAPPPPPAPTKRKVTTDLDGDGISDPLVWRPDTGTFYWLSSSTTSDGTGGKQWGNPALGDVSLSGDLDGDGKADLVIWRASTGTWYWLTSSSGYSYAASGIRQWGNRSLGDVPMLADMDADGKSDFIVWRASTGTWYWLTSSSGYNPAASGIRQWGNIAYSDQPLTGDVDADGRADLAVWRPLNGTWYWITSSSGYNPNALLQVQWGNHSLGDRPLVGDFDGDGRSDMAVWRASTGTWFWIQSSQAYSPIASVMRQWGSAAHSDVPLIMEVDGDGKADIAVWRPLNATWYWLTSSSGYSYATYGARVFGGSGDIPLK